MEDIRSIIGMNLKNIRKKTAYLDNLSKPTNVSISMLGKIEREITNPTITVNFKGNIYHRCKNEDVLTLRAYMILYYGIN